MSLENNTKVKCSNCQQEGDYTIWTSLNVQLDPDQKEKLLNGQLFIYTCPHCHTKTRVIYDMLYHDMEKKIMINSIANDQDVKEAEKFFNGQGMENINELSNILKSMADYKRRIVRKPEELAEKVRIFDQNLDDRVIEVIKIMFTSMFYQENPDFEILDLQYVNEENQDLIIYIGKDETFSTEIEKEFYQVIEEKIKELKLEENYIINQNWALEVFEKLMEQDQ